MSRRENDYQRIKKELRSGKVRGAYVFTGSEDYLMDEAVGEIRAKLLPSDVHGADFSRISGSDYPLEHVLDMVGTVSLFGNSRVVVVTDAPYFGKDHKCSEEALARLLGLCSSCQDEHTVIFYAPEFVKTKKAHRELAALGSVYSFEPLKGAELNAWLRERLAKRGKTAGAQALSLLVSRVGRDLRRLAAELDKLVAYLGGQRELDEKSVLMATARSLQGDIFALTEAVVFGRTARALAQLRDLLASGEPPLRILAMLVRQFRLLGESHDLLERGCPADELALRLGIHPYAAEKLVRQAEKADEATLLRAVDLLLQADLDIKHGRVDQVLALEALVVALGQN